MEKLINAVIKKVVSNLSERDPKYRKALRIFRKKGKVRLKNLLKLVSETSNPEKEGSRLIAKLKPELEKQGYTIQATRETVYKIVPIDQDK